MLPNRTAALQRQAAPAQHGDNPASNMSAGPGLMPDVPMPTDEDLAVDDDSDLPFNPAGSAKTCFKCSRTLPAESFYRHPMMGDGRLGKCKECTRHDVQDNYAKKREAVSRIRPLTLP